MNTAVHPNAEQEKIQQLREWCELHADSGAAAIVETWCDADYRELLRQWGNSYERSLAHLRRIAQVYAGPLRACAGYRPRHL